MGKSSIILRYTKNEFNASMVSSIGVDFKTKDIFGEYDEFTISRLFGLSGAIAMPHLFLPLYYIGFNIGIIYYYHLNEISNKLIADNETEKYFPFKYCYNISPLEN